MGEDSAGTAYAEHPIQRDAVRKEQSALNPPYVADSCGLGSDSSRKERLLFAVTLALLTAVAIFPLWSHSFPALQDYPYHLAQVEILTHRNDAHSPYQAHFETNLRPAPYVAFYAIALSLAQWFPVTVAGKLTISSYFLLWALLIILIQRRASFAPWGSLLLLPLAVNASYYLGFLNYMLSLPLLGVVLLKHGEFSAKEDGWRTAAWLTLSTLGLFFTHPFTFLVYLGLAGLRWTVTPKLWPAWRRALGTPFVSGLVFALWYWIEDAGRGALGSEKVIFTAFSRNVEALILVFSGMGSPLGVSWPSVFCWIGIGLLLMYGLRTSDRTQELRFWAISLGLTVTAALVVPFRMGHYSYINWRIVAVSYLCLGMVAAAVRFRGLFRIPLVALVLAALLLSVAHQQRTSSELEEVAPLIERIPPNSTVLPLLADPATRELDPFRFLLIRHLHNYYHVVRGGGVTPYFFPHPLAPVRYREGSPPPAPEISRPGEFRWGKHGSYEYFLVRGAPRKFVTYLLKNAEILESSGPWLLLRRRDS